MRYNQSTCAEGLEVPHFCMKKINPNLKEEIILKKQGISLIAGVDEVGRGSWAGPLLAAAVILPNKLIRDVRDSKMLSPQKREVLSKQIKEASIDYNFGIVEVSEIDEIGLGKATKLVLERALLGLKIQPEFALIDAFELSHNLPFDQKAIIKGDSICFSIASASIIAKVKRDRMLSDLHKIYPNYGFDKHKGYGTKFHQEMLKKHGPSEVHRKSFKPIKEYYG